MSVFPKAALVSDPIPWRAGRPLSGGGTFTKAEMAKIVEVLNDAKAEKVVYREPSKSEDLWVAFVSLLRGGYIKESYQSSQRYLLTPKGERYLVQLKDQ